MNNEPPEPIADMKDLIVRAQSGDGEAMSFLIERHEPMLIRWARKRLGYPLRTLEETRDIIQDTYAVVIRKIDTFQYEDSRSFARWLRGIVTRIILQKAGGSHLKRRLALPDEACVRDPDLTPSSAAVVRELTEYRYQVLRESPRADRLIYRMRMRGFSSSQISSYVGLSDRGVRMRFAATDARVRLRMKRFVEGRAGE